MAKTAKPKSKPAAEPKPKVAAPETLPDWIDETPGTCYHLLADDKIGGDWKQEVELTHSEFIALKKRLSVMRGYKVPAEAAHAN